MYCQLLPAGVSCAQDYIRFTVKLKHNPRTYILLLHRFMISSYILKYFPLMVVYIIEMFIIADVGVVVLQINDITTV